jgi:hypothetical protein
MSIIRNGAGEVRLAWRLVLIILLSLTQSLCVRNSITNVCLLEQGCRKAA